VFAWKSLDSRRPPSCFALPVHEPRVFLQTLCHNQDCNKLEALYDHATDRVASCIEDVVKLITTEIGPVLSDEAPKPHSDETAEDAGFMATERKLKLNGAVDVLQKVIASKDWDGLQVALNDLCAFVKDPTTAFLIDYDDVKHPACETSCCSVEH
jgi:hypothetical protein